jgi:hypothetical protein
MAGLHIAAPVLSLDRNGVIGPSINPNVRAEVLATRRGLDPFVTQGETESRQVEAAS